MNKEAFIRRLRELLAGLPQNEAAEAIQYYEDYFADAGEENEAKVIEELGSPEKVAANIRADLGMAQEQAGTDRYAETRADEGERDRSSSDRYGSGEYGGNGDYRGGTGSSDRYRGYDEPPKEKHTVLWIVLAICTCYIWFPLILVAVILIFVAVIVVCALSFAFGVTAFALGVTAIALIGVGIVKMFVSPAGGLVLLGGSLVVAGLTIFCVYLAGLLFGSAIPAFFRWLGSLGGKARRRRGGVR